jgi:hypothetical protein
MLEDINTIKTNKSPANGQNANKREAKKSKRYFKEKIRASKVFGSFKLN